MRRNERENSDTLSILSIMRECSVCSLALKGEEFPYVIPVNFGAQEEEGKVCLYFHGSGEGTKIDLIKKDGSASFCMYGGEELEVYEKACASTMRYKSVCGQGKITFVEESSEKVKGLTCIMRQYDKSERAVFNFDSRAVEKTTVLKLTTEHITGKVNRKPN